MRFDVYQNASHVLFFTTGGLFDAKLLQIRYYEVRSVKFMIKIAIVDDDSNMLSIVENNIRQIRYLKMENRFPSKEAAMDMVSRV